MSYIIRQFSVFIVMYLSIYSGWQCGCGRTHYSASSEIFCFFFLSIQFQGIWRTQNTDCRLNCLGPANYVSFISMHSLESKWRNIDYSERKLYSIHSFNFYPFIQNRILNGIDFLRLFWRASVCEWLAFKEKKMEKTQLMHQCFQPAFVRVHHHDGERLQNDA